MANIRQVGVFVLVWMGAIVLYAALFASSSEAGWLISFANFFMNGFIIFRLVFYPAGLRSRKELA